MLLLEAVELDNEEVARQLEFIAGVLESREINPYRVGAYRTAANNIRNLDRSVAEIADTEGEAGLRSIPGVGRSIARSITEFVFTGRMSVLDQVRGRTDPVSVIASLPGVGPDLAERIHEHLGVQTLEELEVAARNGDLSGVPGFGPKRVRGVIDALAGRLGARRRRADQDIPQPPVEEILDVDRQYLEKAESGELRKIAPKRFNPSGDTWLPVMNTRRGNHFYTVLYSNTARAHEQGKTRDWVVVYYDTPEGSGQNTVVTSRVGSTSGKRVVRGREDECEHYYEALDHAA